MLTAAPHPLLDLRAFVTRFPRPPGEIPSSLNLQDVAASGRARAAIADVQPTKVSVRPTGLGQQRTPQESVDLAAFSKACKYDRRTRTGIPVVVLRLGPHHP